LSHHVSVTRTCGFVGRGLTQTRHREGDYPERDFRGISSSDRAWKGRAVKDSAQLDIGPIARIGCAFPMGYYPKEKGF
jgi:hypothetical protein